VPQCSPTTLTFFSRIRFIFMASISPPTKPTHTSRASNALHFRDREIMPTGSKTTSGPCPFGNLHHYLFPCWCTRVVDYMVRTLFTAGLGSCAMMIAMPECHSHPGPLSSTKMAAGMVETLSSYNHDRNEPLSPNLPNPERPA